MEKPKQKTKNEDKTFTQEMEKNEQNTNYLCMQKHGSRYLKPRSGPREQPVTNLMKKQDPIIIFLKFSFSLSQLETRSNQLLV